MTPAAPLRNDASLAAEAWLTLLAAAIVLGVAWLLYRPGLDGGFLFDDYGNLPAIGATGPVDNAATLARYLTSGTADPTGRPLTLATFLFDARDWPADPYPFKRSNLILHLINGALLILLLRALGRTVLPATQNRARIDFAAVLGGAFWLLHPLLVSTTLYIVQREAMLPATFTLIGLLLWLRGREAFRRARRLAGGTYMVIGLGACTLLATLSKANGALLPALALTVEAFFLTACRGQQAWPEQAWRSYRRWLALWAGVPTLLVAAYLLQAGWQGLVHGVAAIRPWTLAQRLLTEPRVLMDYLRLLWLPRPFTTGLFNDQYLASTSPWQPATTLPALLAVIGLLIAAWLLRRRAPMIALAIAFYFVGQSMESSTLALELYFEHRNYLPALLMFWPLAWWLCGLPLRDPQRATPTQATTSNGMRAVIAIVLLVGLGWMTHARAELWGNMRDQALLWAALNPQSPRAQAYAAQADMQTGHPDRAAARLQTMLVREPQEVQVAINLLAARCQQGHLDEATLDAAALALRTTRDTGSLLHGWFERAIAQSKAPPCPELTLANLARLLDAAQANPRLSSLPGRQQDLFHLRGRIALAQHQPQAALRAFDAGLDQEPGADAALSQAALLGAAGYPELGLAHLDRYEALRARVATPAFGMPRIHAWVLQRQHYWDNELSRLRQTLREDARSHSKRPA